MNQSAEPALKNYPPAALVERNGLPGSLSIVIPCYNEEEVLGELHKRLMAVLATIPISKVEVILVDDGSKDSTWKLMLDLAKNDTRIKVVRLSRNYGHQIALTCGLDQARGEVVLILDADLQDPPELLSEMLRLWQKGYEVVYGRRKSRQGETALKRFFAFAFYRLITKITGIEIPPDTGDFRLMDRRAVDALVGLRERHRFVRGMVSWIGFTQTPIFYERPERFAGVTKYPFRKSLKLAFDAITSFSYMPLRLASYLGFCLSAISLLYIVVVIVLKFMGISFPGYTSIMASILLIGGVELIVLGIIGEYVGRIFEQGQARPLYLIDRIEGEPLRNTGHNSE